MYTYLHTDIIVSVYTEYPTVNLRVQIDLPVPIPVPRHEPNPPGVARLLEPQEPQPLASHM